MAQPLFADLLDYLYRISAAQHARELPDPELLQQFIANRAEAAFAALVRRHGPMVFGVCQRVLRDQHLAEDAFQATFLVLARKASSIRKQEQVGAWLHGVARRIARRARAKADLQHQR